MNSVLVKILVLILIAAGGLFIALSYMQESHVHSLTVVDGKAPTCTEKGTESYYVCDGCQDYFSLNDGEPIDAPVIFDPLGHSFTEYISNGDATCEADGTKTAKCDRCDETHTIADEGSKLGHDYSSAWTSDANGHWYVCANGCGIKGSESAHTPNIESATETESKVCTECGYVIEAALGHVTHNYNLPQYDDTHHWNKCYGCEAIDEKIAHSYSESIITDATCTVAGTKKLSCDCGHSKNETIPAKGHTEEPVAGKDATCTETGLTEGKKCSVCGEVLKAQEEIPAKDHTPAEAIRENEVPASCKAEGSYDNVVKCSVCGEELSRKTEVIEKLNHTEETVSGKDATCTETGLTEGKKCSVCGEILKAQEEIPAKNHSFTNYISNGDATCEADGTKTAKCDRCDETHTVADEGSKLGHDYSSAWTSDASGHWYVCANGCGIKGSESAHTPNIESATETESKVCTECGYVIEAALGHTTHNYNLPQYDDTHHWNKCYGCEAIDEKIAHSYSESIIANATCNVAGTKKLSCDCGHSKNETIPAKDHIPAEAVRENEVASTCKAEGSYDLVVKCSVCSKELSRTTETIEKLAHTEEIVKGYAATCTENGLTDGKKCSVCGEVLDAQITVDALGHTEGQWIVDKEATCTESGSKHQICSVCRETIKTETINTIPHSYEAKVTAPTCEEAGYTTYTCSACGDSYKDPNSHVDSLGHKGSVVEIENEILPTCTTDGSYDNVIYCTVCEKELSRLTIPDPAKGHNIGSYILIDPACTTEGLEVTSCTRCDYYKEDVVPATGHKEETIPGKAATCTEDGLTDGKQCTVCKVTTVEQTTVDALGHSPKEEVKENEKAADCINAGSYDLVVYCSVCSEKLSSESITVDAFGHTKVIDAAKAPTCTEVGLTAGKHCGVCNTVLVAQNEIEKLSHKWTMTNVVVDDTTVTYDYVCESCGIVEHKYGPIAQEKHVCDHTVHGIETEYGSWTECSCGARSWAQTALSAYNGSGAKHTSVDAYVPDGNGGWTKTGIKVSDVATSYNLGTSGGDKSKEYLEFTYKITAPEAMTVDVFVNGRSTNTSGSNNAAVRLSNFIELYQDGNKVEVEYEALFPEYKEGSPYWTEQRVATIELKEGENTITFRYIKHKLSDGSIEYISGKVYGGYLSYFRFAEASKIDEGCESGAHNLELVNEKAAGCYDGVKAHYICDDCGKLFDLENKMETEEKYLAIPRIYHSHIYENVARLQDDGTYAYECTRGCGATRAHECTGGTHLIIAKEPNQVWYEEGDSFNPDRMEVYLSTACIEGCSGNTVVAGHLKKYDALTYTYQNGDSFKAGDTKITINYTLDGVTYSADLPVTVTAVGGTITVDDSDEGFSFVDKASGKDSGSRTAGHRTNDQGRVGQSAYGGSYVNNFDNGDSATFKFTLDEAASGANIVLRASSERMNGAGGTPPRGYAISVNDVVIIKIDGQIVELSDDVILKGSVDNLDQTANRWVWTNWMNLDLGTYDLAAGEHTVEIIIDTALSTSVAGTDTNAYTASIQLDCLNVFLG